MSGFDISMYRDMFVEEAEELFESADNVLLEAEKNGSLTDDEMGQLFRDVHTLKGSGASVELAYFAEFTHDVENMMDKLRNKAIAFIPEMAGTLIDGLDVMKEVLRMECDEEINRENFTEMTADLLVIIRAYINGEGESSSAPEANTDSSQKEDESKPVIPETVASKPSSSAWGFFGEEAVNSSNQEEGNFGFFDDSEAISPSATISNEVESSVPTPAAAPVPAPAKKAEAKAPASKKEAPIAKKPAPSTIRVNLDKIDLLMNNVGDLVITNAMLTQFSATIKENKVRSSVLERLELLERHIREMQDSIMSIRMVPMESIYSKFPKVVRDISKKLNKKITFEHEGDTVEIDKAMIEGLTDPLMHIIRNSLDHGIEMPEDRVSSGKSEMGTITISAEQANGQMIITIKDDGNV